MKSINRHSLALRQAIGRMLRILCVLLIILLTGCGNRNLPMAYSVSSDYAAFKMFDVLDEAPTARPFAADLVVVPGDYVGDVYWEMMEATGAAIFATDDKKVLYAQNVYERLSPASLTKIMTALVALKYTPVDTFVTASSNVTISEARAQTVGLERGDQLTLSQALHLSLINSANDAAIVVAEGVAGTVEEFVMLMNREARALGATNTNFMNPHGLSHEDQYSTIYDMYLILNAAVKYEMFNHIISLPNYTTTYYRANGSARELSIQNTNQYLHGTFDVPNGVTMIGGKTGTTQAAGHCLAIVAKDEHGKTYLSIIMRADSRDEVYLQTSELLRQIP